MMASYLFTCRDFTDSSKDNRKTGLTPKLLALISVTNPGNSIGTITNGTNPLCPIAEIGAGVYRIQYDAWSFGDAIASLDMGDTVPNPNDRFLSVYLTRNVWQYAIEDGINSGQALDLILAIAIANVSNIGSNSDPVTIAKPLLNSVGQQNIPSRLTATVDMNGNRSSVVATPNPDL